MRLPLALALSASLISPAWAMSRMDLPAGYSSPHEYIGAAFAFLATAWFFAFVGRFFKSPDGVKALTYGVIGMLVLSVQCFALDSDGTEPDPVLTPGAVRTTDRAEIVGETTARVRDVSGSEKLAVYRRYGMKGPHDVIPGTDHMAPFEVDHRVPLCAGGANDITNLWIEAGDGPWTFHDKDRLEDRICTKLKKGLVTPEQAQAVFLGDWKAGFVAEFGGAPR